MTNNAKRDVVIDVNGKTYVLRINLNTLCLLETALSTPTHEMTFREAIELIDRKSVTATRGLLWASLQAHHPNVTLEDAGNLMQELGGVTGIEKTLADAVAAMAASQTAPTPIAKRTRAARA